ncbi:hypothetical protein THAOC_36023 [Thalassiosira oceanica]|uniref:Uncharacterized protein n=1 Tax=Thalassiosira oceanica TaxID=159749 RepID=K0R2F7_THAOC|nr:hypothetical protein THAOC_36023 [Thalassiosira oceanica]|eukprot:EJK45364.1 hypothetical protein THAOC_36023 [Thalassiosira oceanica]
MPVRRLFGGVGTDTLLEVNLAGNGIKSNGDRCIAEFLSTNPQLRSLYLERNQLNDHDALHIGLALQSNTNLTYLDLDDNMLTENGKKAVHCLAFFGVSRSDLSKMNSDTVIEINLNTVSDANHTCEISGIDQPCLDWAINLPNSAKRNRRRKLFCILAHRFDDDCTINHLESEFSEGGMGLVPHVLACINTYTEDYKSLIETSATPDAEDDIDCLSMADELSYFNLSLLFELARDWKTPEMYQFHHSSSIQS